MKTHLENLARYNAWANENFHTVLCAQTDGLLTTPVVSRFPNILETVKHLYDAETAWWLRVNEPDMPYDFKAPYPGPFGQLCREHAQRSAQWTGFIESRNEKELAYEFTYKRAGTEMRARISDMLVHLFNHGTYHRGQLVTMMRQVGMKDIPSTDYILFCRMHMPL